jgi:hypothetical protein
MPRAQPVAEQIAEEMVEAEPLVMVVDRDEEHRVASSSSNRPRLSGTSSTCSTSAGRHAVEHREPEQEIRRSSDWATSTSSLR